MYNIEAQAVYVHCARGWSLQSRRTGLIITVYYVFLNGCRPIASQIYLMNFDIKCVARCWHENKMNTKLIEHAIYFPK